jgi:hypothetical protein
MQSPFPFAACIIHNQLGWPHRGDVVHVAHECREIFKRHFTRRGTIDKPYYRVISGTEITLRR